jgi:hypothetical protein
MGKAKMSTETVASILAQPGKPILRKLDVASAGAGFARFGII